MAVTDATRNEVWQGYVETERIMRYYVRLSGEFQFRHTGIRFVLLFSIAGGIAFPADSLPVLLQVWGPVAIIALAIWDHVANYAKKAAITHAVCVQCGELEVRWRHLWNDVDAAGSEEGDIRVRMEALESALVRITSIPGVADVRVSKRLNEKVTGDAYVVMRTRYALHGTPDNPLIY